MTYENINGDCAATLPTIEAGSVQTCVTSPPYFGLRDYGVPGQIGLEETPELYVAKMVEVFREVRRVLRDDGTLFLNLGDSYFGSSMSGGVGKGTIAGTQQGARKGSDLRFKSLRAGRVQACGSADKEVSDYLSCDSSSQSPDGGRKGSSCSRTSGTCLRHAATLTRASCSRIRVNTATLLAHLPIEGSALPLPIRQSSAAILETLQIEAREVGRLLASLESTRLESSVLLLDGGMLAEHVSAFLSSLRSLAAYVPAFVRKSVAALETPDCMERIASLCEELDCHIQCIDGSCSLFASYLIIRDIEPQRSALKPKDLIGIPWMVAFALRADGWYLRSDIIWHKPNPMPESVTDRPTKAHEYLFLLSKSASYYYDADVIREPTCDKPVSWEQRKALGEPMRRGLNVGTFADPHLGSHPLGRNRRSVWTVATKPFPEAHFATFPEDLIEPCILAGSRAGDTVLDPFSGAGTTGVVAVKHGRKYLGCELNPEYVEMSERRLAVAEAMAKRARGEWAEIPRLNRRQIETPLFGEVPA